MSWAMTTTANLPCSDCFATCRAATPRFTLLAIKRAEARASRKLSFADVAYPEAPHLEPMLAGEIQWAMQQMFRQYDAIAGLLVPEQQVPEVTSQPQPTAKPARSKQPMFNLGE